ncbi:unnamed protein product [Cuscuta campestris]|uniref:Endonuclease/exonuclease/phosphatase domain-containing protein n=1 Tax=Cuscuta campestris TaxID=132261 RepID=A0A484NB74_9ASTE|nr:unnamed protein product [Cuscuta campestris]
MEVQGGFSFGNRNQSGDSLLEFVGVSDLVVVNSCFPKREDHLTTFLSRVRRTQIDYLLLHMCDWNHRILFKDGKVLPNENHTTQHKLLVMEVTIKWVKQRHPTCGLARIRWGSFYGEKILELIARVQEKGVWESSVKATDQAHIVICIREAAKEVLGVSCGAASRHKGDWLQK